MNFMNWLTIAAGIAQTVIQLVKLVEAPGNGASKKEMVLRATLGAVDAALKNTGNTVLTKDQFPIVAEFAADTVDGTVKMLNDTGEFKKTTEVVVEPVK